MNTSPERSILNQTVTGGIDGGKFTSMNTYHMSITQKRSTGFIDFNLQMKRPSFPVNHAHEHRFQYLDPFPKPLT